MFPADNAWNTDISQAAPLGRLHGHVPRRDDPVARLRRRRRVRDPVRDGPRRPAGRARQLRRARRVRAGPVPDTARRAGRERRRPPRARGAPGRVQALRALSPPSGPGAGWTRTAAPVFDLRSNALRPAGWTSADAAGLPILAGLARRDEVAAGAIRHALRITVPRTSDAYIHPATHAAATGTAADPPMGLRLRLRADYPIAGFGPQARAVAQALKTYGALVADNSGGDPNRIYVSGAHRPRAGTTTTSDALKHDPRLGARGGADRPGDPGALMLAAAAATLALHGRGRRSGLRLRPLARARGPAAGRRRGRADRAPARRGGVPRRRADRHPRPLHGARPGTVAQRDRRRRDARAAACGS